MQGGISSNGHSSRFLAKLAGNFHNPSAKRVFRIELAIHTKPDYLPYWLQVWTKLKSQNVLFHTSPFQLEDAEGKIMLLHGVGDLNQQLFSCFQAPLFSGLLPFPTMPLIL